MEGGWEWGKGGGAFGMGVVSVKESVTLCIRSKLSMSHYASVLN